MQRMSEADIGPRVDRGLRGLLGQVLPALQERAADAQLATQLGEGQLPPLYSGELLPLKLRRIDPPSIGLPGVLLHDVTLRCG